MTRIVLEGGPFDGEEMAIIARELPSYFMLIDGAFVNWKVPLVVGAGFDDHWPGQSKYERAGAVLGPNERDELELRAYLYRYAP